ncbi:hypothetical protein K6W12_16960 [Burkholderia multivorans]|uniref:hypothetical protein n=1 Tax=Burkholderia multivorans TaxID=87883 RepID=UPI001C9829CE|nr:hypothetical protein [Burkholderia multivorans]MBY4672326.1 hypothetical protein [Burkholderia multivorans]
MMIGRSFDAFANAREKGAFAACAVTANAHMPATTTAADSALAAIRRRKPAPDETEFCASLI